MNLPKDTNLPFFAYGVFKPGQLGFFQIKDFTDKYSPYDITGVLYERDGVPLFNPEKAYSKVKGYLITFKENQQDEAYKRIADTEPDYQYTWDTVEISGTGKANILAGKKIKKGSILCEYNYYDGNKDPLFNEALEIIESMLIKKPQSSEMKHDFSNPISEIFYLQMAYMLLWSSIERYGSLKYGMRLGPVDKNKKMSSEPAFRDGLRNTVKGERTVFSAIEPRKKIVLNPEKPEKSMDYYYQIRSNTVHRGKSVFHDKELIEASLKELLTIFRGMLSESFKSASVRINDVDNYQ